MSFFNILSLPLPRDIIDMIIPYTYDLQNKIILEDIQNYQESKAKIHQLYYNTWMKYVNSIVPEDRDWILQNLFRYADNYDLPTSDFYKIFLKRNLCMATRPNANLSKLSVDSQINVYWGFLTPTERNQMIDTYTLVNKNNPNI
jgi:hypothetical protein